MARALSGETVRYEEDEVQTAEGPRWYNWEARPWRNADGEIVGVVSHGANITALAQVRAVAAANETRLKMAMDSFGGVVWEIDFKDRVIHWHGDPAPLTAPRSRSSNFRTNTTTVLHDDDKMRWLLFRPRH